MKMHTDSTMTLAYLSFNIGEKITIQISFVNCIKNFYEGLHSNLQCDILDIIVFIILKISFLKMTGKLVLKVGKYLNNISLGCLKLLILYKIIDNHVVYIGGLCLLSIYGLVLSLRHIPHFHSLFFIFESKYHWVNFIIDDHRHLSQKQKNPIYLNITR